MKNYIVILFGNVVSNIFVGSQDNWTDDHMAQFPGATHVFTDFQPAIGSVYDSESNSFEAPIDVVVNAEDVVVDSSSEVIPE